MVKIGLEVGLFFKLSFIHLFAVLHWSWWDGWDELSENFGFRCCATLIIVTSMPMSAMYRVLSEQIIMFVEIKNW